MHLKALVRSDKSAVYSLELPNACVGRVGSEFSDCVVIALEVVKVIDVVSILEVNACKCGNVALGVLLDGCEVLTLEGVSVNNSLNHGLSFSTDTADIGRHKFEISDVALIISVALRVGVALLNVGQALIELLSVELNSRSDYGINRGGDIRVFANEAVLFNESGNNRKQLKFIVLRKTALARDKSENIRNSLFGGDVLLGIVSVEGSSEDVDVVKVNDRVIHIRLSSAKTNVLDELTGELNTLNGSGYRGVGSLRYCEAIRSLGCRIFDRNIIEYIGRNYKVISAGVLQRADSASNRGIGVGNLSLAEIESYELCAGGGIYNVRTCCAVYEKGHHIKSPCGGWCRRRKINEEIINSLVRIPDEVCRRAVQKVTNDFEVPAVGAILHRQGVSVTVCALIDYLVRGKATCRSIFKVIVKNDGFLVVLEYLFYLVNACIAASVRHSENRKKGHTQRQSHKAHENSLCYFHTAFSLKRALI